ncbi:hypothetical protein [Deinococcus sp. UYEF24]
MTLHFWLARALTSLEPAIRSRLETEYTAHFEEAMQAGGDRTQALTELGDPVVLNSRLRRVYLTIEDAASLDRRSTRISSPRLAWGMGLMAVVFAVLLRDRAGLLFLLAVALTLGVRMIALRTLSSRRAALVVLLSQLPTWLVVIGGPWLGRHAAWTVQDWFLLLGGGVGMMLMISGPVLRLWVKVWRHG